MDGKTKIHIKPREAKQLLKQEGVTFDAKLSELFSPLHDFQGYRLPDGQVLMVYKKSSQTHKPSLRGKQLPKIEAAILYASYGAFLQDIDETEKQKEELIIKAQERRDKGLPAGTHILEDVLPEPEVFEAQIPMLLRELPARLGIPRESIDMSYKCLNLVGKAVRKLGGSRCIEPDIFAPLIAYAGEMIRSRTEGHWCWFIDPDGQLYEPFIQDTEGYYYNPWLRLFDELLEGRPPHVEWIIRYEIEGGRMPKAR